MTTLYTSSETCAICGNMIEFTGIGSTNCFGRSDLDGRPAQMLRSTLGFSVRHCKQCGYCAEELSIATDAGKLLVKSNAYQDCLKNIALPLLANKFLCVAMIHALEGDSTSAGDECLAAAWVCDDFKKTDAAMMCRNKAISHYESAIENQQRFREDENQQGCLLADLYRRTGQFEKQNKYAAIP